MTCSFGLGVCINYFRNFLKDVSYGILDQVVCPPSMIVSLLFFTRVASYGSSTKVVRNSVLFSILPSLENTWGLLEKTLVARYIFHALEVVTFLDEVRDFGHLTLA